MFDAVGSLPAQLILFYLVAYCHLTKTEVIAPFKCFIEVTLNKTSCIINFTYSHSQ